MMKEVLSQYVEYHVSSVIQLKDKYGYRVELIFMDGSKVQQQKGGFSTKKEAELARDRTVGELYAGTYVVNDSVKVAEFMNFWLEEDIAKRVRSHETYATYSSIVRNHINPVLGNKKLIEVSRADIQKLYRDKTAYSESVARSLKTVMNTAMKYGVRQKMIAENPAEGISLPKEVKKKGYRIRNIDTQKTLTLEQIYLLLEASKETPIYLQVLFNVLMGLRRSEIIGVKYSDIDYTNRTLHLRRQLGKRINTKKEDFAPKTFTKQEIALKTESSERDLPIPDYVFEAILEQRKVYEKNRARRKEQFQDLGYICCSSYGRPRSKDYHWSYYKKLLKDNNLPDIRWHDLRSTFCTLLLKNDFSSKAVSKLMGHAKEIITMDVYGDNRNIIADCIDELQPFIDEVIPEDTADIGILTDAMDILIDTELFLSM